MGPTVDALISSAGSVVVAAAAARLRSLSLLVTLLLHETGLVSTSDVKPEDDPLRDVLPFCFLDGIYHGCVCGSEKKPGLS